MKRYLSAALLISGLSFAASTSQAQSLYPTVPDARDYELGYFAPNNSVAVNVYARHEGSKGLTQNTFMFRATHILKTENWVFVPIDFLLPVVSATAYVPLAEGSPLSGALHGNGIGDLIWIPSFGTGLVQDAKIHTHTWAGFTGYTTIPVGNYNSKDVINAGGHRWKFQPTLAIGQRFARAFTVEAFGNVQVIGKNTDYHINPLVVEGTSAGVGKAAGAAAGTLVTETLSGKKTNDTKLGAGAGLMTGIDLSPSFTVTASYYYQHNGRQSLSNLDLSRLPGPLAAAPAVAGLAETEPKQNLHTLRFGLSMRATQQTQLLFQLNQDIKATGPSEHLPISRGFYVRVTHLFFPPPKAPTPGAYEEHGAAPEPPAAPGPVHGP
jgi:Putative MetA-pathway of phenol degradation